MFKQKNIYQRQPLASIQDMSALCLRFLGLFTQFEPNFQYAKLLPYFTANTTAGRRPTERLLKPAAASFILQKAAHKSTCRRLQLPRISVIDRGRPSLHPVSRGNDASSQTHRHRWSENFRPLLSLKTGGALRLYRLNNDSTTAGHDVCNNVSW